MDTITHQPQDTTWIQDFDWANELFLYPNPSHESFSIMNMNGLSIQEVNIFNEFGQKVKMIVQPTGNIDVSDLARGIYLVELKANNEKHRRKLVKQ
jgi:hypothetical protein